MSIRLRRAALPLLLLASLATACGGGDGSTDAGSDPTAEPAASTPAVEGTDHEQPAPDVDKPDIEIVGGPVGGSTDEHEDGTGILCADVQWLGDQDEANLGGGISFHVTAIDLDGASRASASCGDDSCDGFTFDSDSDNCVVAVRPGDSDGTLSVQGRIECSAEPRQCAEFRSNLRQRTIEIPAAETGTGEEETEETEETTEPEPSPAESPGE